MPRPGESRSGPGFRRLAAVALLSGATLAWEILLIRLFTIVDWHHFAFLVISLALLGYGVSGTLLALARAPLLRQFDAATAGFAALFAMTSIGGFLISQRIELNSLEIVWSGRQMAILFFLYLLFAVPFLCTATALGLTMVRFGEHSGGIYRADLIGAGAGALGVTLLLFVVHPLSCLQFIGLAGLFAATLFASRTLGTAGITAAGLVSIGLVVAVRPLLFPLRVSQFKELSQTLRIPGARVLEERVSPLALLSIVESEEVPFRFAPGLSLGFAGEIPKQIGVFSDASGMTPITRYDGTPESVSHLGEMTAAAAYRLRPSPPGRVAVLGAGGGSEVLSALIHGARAITAVELNPQTIDLMTGRYAEFSGHLYTDPRVKVVTAEARQFLRESPDRWDLIQIALVDSFGASGAGLHALSASHLYTVEAIEEMLSRLAPEGLLVITRWMQLPPRGTVKLLATAIVALEQIGARPAENLALVRSWNTATLIVKRSAFNTEETAALRRFAETRSFDVDYAPGLQRSETNRYNILDESYLYDSASALLAGGAAREELYDRYKFYVRPATDERPYFSHFFKWRVLPELVQLRGRGGMPLIEWGYLILIAALLQALIASVALIILPLVLIGRRSREPARATRTLTSRSRLILYFGSIGLAFLFVEIAFIERLTLFLGHPLFAITVVLASFLFFAGMGSGVSSRLPGTVRPGVGVTGALPLLVAIIALIELLLMRILVDHGLALPSITKIVASVALVAPLALVMGMPFPLGLRDLSRHDPAAIPWAWAINGTASVLSSICATLLAIHFGFSTVIVAAAVLYAVAGWAGGSEG
ncbi:MAG TPA: SAM-dependent methyltransferase [Thermoanaerobaculia bacterium]|nr:SAM-dependent methyltransferase [Thermoanaerobaculia bacterium]